LKGTQGVLDILDTLMTCPGCFVIRIALEHMLEHLAGLAQVPLTLEASCQHAQALQQFRSCRQMAKEAERLFQPPLFLQGHASLVPPRMRRSTTGR
jgi:hypothetical protein